MIDFTGHVRRESVRFAEAIQRAADADGALDATLLDATVPSCPDWRLADLIWHLSEVQDFWAHILDENISGPEGYERPPRPDDGALLDFIVQRSANLVAALERRQDDEPCWSWSPKGGTVGWVRRRQAQEALVHRVDAELTVGDSTPINDALAGDGVDEILRVMLDIGELPGWLSFHPEDGRVVLDAGNRWWALTLGRVTGRDPEAEADVEALDLPALSVVDAGDGSGEAAVVDGDTRIAASAADLNLWLWGRIDATALKVVGDVGAATRLRQTAADATK